MQTVDLGTSFKTKSKQGSPVLGVKHCFSSRKTCWVPTRSWLRSHTSWPRYGPNGHIRGNEVGKTWVSLWRTRRTWTWRTWMLKSQLLYSKSEISWDEFENMDLGTHTWRSYENKHKNMDLDTNFWIKTWFYFKNTRTSFSLSKTNFKSMHGSWIMLDHAMWSDQHKA